MIPAFARMKTIHALDSAAIVIGSIFKILFQDIRGWTEQNHVTYFISAHLMNGCLVE
jgi:hypothetical protein